MQSDTKRWVFLALVVGVLAISYAWLNGVPGVTQAGNGEAQGKGTTPSAKVPAPNPGQAKVVLQDLGMT